MEMSEASSDTREEVYIHQFQRSQNSLIAAEGLNLKISSHRNPSNDLKDRLSQHKNDHKPFDEARYPILSLTESQ